MNMISSRLPPLALIAGPTASGKSAIALALAERTGGVVINADSAQVYRDLSVVTARPSSAEEARASHRLYGYRDGAEACSAADWASDARAAIADAHDEGRLPILAGGTGLYIRTLIDGIAPVPAIEPDVRNDVRALTTNAAYAALASEDPASAARLRPSDSSRIARALEVVRSTGRPLGEWQKQPQGGIGNAVSLHPLVLLPPREWLYERCNARFEKMFSYEGIEEVRSLLMRALPASLPIMRAIGVPEIAGFLSGALTRDQAVMAGRLATRHYAKRQYTWFRRQTPAEWPRFVEPIAGDAVETALAMLGV